MSTVRVAVVYYSTYGTNHQMAEIAAEAARAAGAEVRLRKVRETAPEAVVAGQDAWRAQAERTAHVEVATPDDLEWANAYLFSAPTRYGVSAQDLRRWNNLTQNAVGVGKRLRIVSDVAPAGKTRKVRRAAGNHPLAAKGTHRAGD